MKAFSFLNPELAQYWAAAVAALILPFSVAQAGEDPTVAGALTELRRAPIFSAEPISLAKTWGPALPVGTAFQVEKVYGRWVYGKPAPLAHMKPVDYSPAGWVYTRSLLVPGDQDTLPSAVVNASRSVVYHAKQAWKKLGLGREPLLSPLDFYETLALSRNTLLAFSRPETPASGARFAFFPQAMASEEESPAPLGLTGSDLSFLDQEIKVIRARKKGEAHQRELRRLKVPYPPGIDDGILRAILGRYMLERYLELPPITSEEVDGYIYMRATALRALRGCPKAVQAHWANRRWNYFRVYGLKSRPEVRHPWFEIALPGGYFALSGRAIEVAANEAELAFVLVRQLVRELHLKRAAIHLDKKGWPGVLQARSEEIWDQVLKAQSTKDSANLDVSDEIAVDLTAAECIAKAGYRPFAAVAYLRKLSLNREQPWSEWLNRHSIGLDYRIERVTTLIREGIAEQKFPDGTDSQAKRFASAAKQWNILP